MMLLSRPMVGEAAEYNSACVNTLRRSLDGNYSPATRAIWWLFFWTVREDRGSKMLRKVDIFLKFLCCVLSLFFVAACTSPTSYGPNGFRGGYSEEQLSADSWAVKAEGNIYSTKSQMLDMVMLRAAELTVDNGFTNFEVTGGDGAYIRTLSWIAPARSVSSGSGNTYISGNTATTYVNTRTTHYSESHGSADIPEANIIAKMYEKDEAPKSAYDAKKVMSAIKPRFFKQEGQGEWVSCQDRANNTIFETSADKCTGANLLIKERL